MPITLEAAPTAVLNVMNGVKFDHFQDLISADVAIEVIMASAPKGRPAVKIAGSPALAKIKKVPREQTVTGGPDVRILVDATRYAKLGQRRKEALFAHELEHVELTRDEETGEWVKDDYDRPKIKLKPDDWLITGFAKIHAMYGEDSCEQMSFNTLSQILGQKTFGFMAADGAGEPVAGDLDDDADDGGTDIDRDDGDDDDSDDTAETEDDSDPDADEYDQDSGDPATAAETVSIPAGRGRQRRGKTG